MFEYSRKGLPHALLHARELVETGGHHGAYCSSVAEAQHKVAIKRAAQFSRTLASKNETQLNMLAWVLRHELYDAIQEIHCGYSEEKVSSPEEEQEEEGGRLYKFWTPLSYCRTWQQLDFHGVGRHGIPFVWAQTFLSPEVLITREELLVLLRTKLELNHTATNLHKIRRHLFIRCYGSITIKTPGCVTRKIVGVSAVSEGRRDFVQLAGTESGTALAAQVHTYVFLSAYTNCLYTSYIARIQTYLCYTSVCIRHILRVYEHVHNVCCLYTCNCVCIRTQYSHICILLVGHHVRRNKWLRRCYSQHSHASPSALPKFL